jgi:hypothetical protein
MSLGNSKSVLGDLTDITGSRNPCIAFTFCISLTIHPENKFSVLAASGSRIRWNDKIGWPMPTLCFRKIQCNILRDVY